MRQLAGWALMIMPQLKIEPLSWVGQTVAFYLDDDPIWQEAAKAENEQQLRAWQRTQADFANYRRRIL